MHARRLVTGLAVTAAALTSLAGPVAAAPKSATPQADLIGVVKIDQLDPTVATVKARYRCRGDLALWVSVKQVSDRSADPALAEEGSSNASAAWSDSHPEDVTCNGRWQTQTFTVDQTTTWPGRGGAGLLAKGEAYVQFCLTDPGAEGPEGLVISQNEFLHVRA